MINEKQVKLNQFYKFPKWLLDMKNVSNNAKILYMLLWDRLDLSIKNNWIDEEGNVFIYFTIKDICQKLKISNKSAVKYKKELFEVGLIHEKKQMNQSSKIYLDSVESTQRKCKKYTYGSVENTLTEVYKVHSNKTEYNKTNNINTKNNNKILSESISSSSVLQFIQSDLDLWQITTPNMIDEVNHQVNDIGEELTKYAWKTAVDSGKPFVKYVNGIIRNWKAQGIKSVEQVKASKREEQKEEVSKYGW